MNDKQYITLEEQSDKDLLKTIGNFVQTQRLRQNQSQTQVSDAAGISRSTLSLLERGQKVRLDTLIQVLRVLGLLYVLNGFKVEEEISPIAYAKLKKKERKYASNKRSGNNILEEDEPLEW